MTRIEKKYFSETKPFKRSVFIKTKPWNLFWLINKKGWFVGILLMVVGVFYLFKCTIENEPNYYHVFFFSLPGTLLCFKFLKKSKKRNQTNFCLKKLNKSKKK
jgi:hypothetical protein